MVIGRAIVLAAGRGTRLGNATRHIPKPMLEIGGRPLIKNIVAAIATAGITSVTVVTGYHASTIEEYLAARSQIPVAFVRQPAPEGTAAAVRLARHATGDMPFLLCWGDIATASEHYLQVINAWRPGFAATIGVNLVDDVGRHASVVFGSDKRIKEIVEKPVGSPPSLWNNSGLMVLGPQVWEQLERIEPSQRGELELPDAINRLAALGEIVEAVQLKGLWFDIGTPAELEAARSAFSTGAATNGP
ncbi:MAG: NTP transferase domain-containing protein [bacterium]|nr:NTP transferase domain-containing protein [bacterium]